MLSARPPAPHTYANAPQPRTMQTIRMAHPEPKFTPPPKSQSLLAHNGTISCMCAIPQRRRSDVSLPLRQVNDARRQHNIYGMLRQADRSITVATPLSGYRQSPGARSLGVQSDERMGLGSSAVRGVKVANYDGSQQRAPVTRSFA